MTIVQDVQRFDLIRYIEKDDRFDVYLKAWRFGYISYEQLLSRVIVTMAQASAAVNAAEAVIGGGE